MKIIRFLDIIIPIMLLGAFIGGIYQLFWYMLFIGTARVIIDANSLGEFWLEFVAVNVLVIYCVARCPAFFNKMTDRLVKVDKDVEE